MVNLSPLFEIKTLTRLDATKCGLQGDIPAKGLLGLSQLERLDLSMINLNGSIPPEIGKLSNLRFLSFASNQLTEISQKRSFLPLPNRPPLLEQQLPEWLNSLADLQPNETKNLKPTQ
ncbi:hypothetical protein HPP92_013995 [Vanilla planifolia]|uniref:Uncharacterized protein n=1 Tax=Vanilla planifolia TaxID=51239 RepID=A0A835QR30_VANPL|nr:hypothetical protein HPP92_013995 [Vanilla planifolia]